MKIYVPTELLNKPCYVINNGYIRVYTNNNLTEYLDVYVNQDYMLKQGTSYNGYNGVCDTINTYTDEIYYRRDFSDICIVFFVLFIFIFLIPFKIVSRVFGRWLKV